MKPIPSNPFATAHGAYQSADDRVHALERFSLEQCRAALTVTGLQKAVEKKLHSRIRKLEKVNG